MRVDASAVRRWAGAVLCLLLVATPAAAQFDRGTISGVVKDQSGGVVPGVDGHGEEPADAADC